MKTRLSLLAMAFIITCGSYQGAQPTTTLTNKNASLEATSNAAASSAGEASAAVNGSTQSQTQNADLWDPSDERHVADRMLERVKREGVVKIVSVRASETRYVFVGEFKETWRFALTQPPRPKTDLWVVNKNGTGLQRLTENRTVTGNIQLTDDRESYEPEWSPSGDSIVFVNSGSVCVLDIRSEGVGEIINVMGAQKPSDDGLYAGYFEYAQPKWSPNGKAIAALESDGKTTCVVVADTRGGKPYCRFAKGAKGHQWNSENELILDYGKFVFDWKSLLSDDRPPPREPATEAETSNTETRQAEAALRDRLLNFVKSEGVIGIRETAPSPSGDKLIFSGEFEQGTMFPTSDLWRVNRDGSGLRRLTKNRGSYGPVWSPSGKEVAFINGRSINVMDVGANKVRELPGLEGYVHMQGEDWHADSNYFRPVWSPDGKALAAEGCNGGYCWVTAVDSRSGKELIGGIEEPSSYKWNDKGQLVLGGYGRLVLRLKVIRFRKAASRSK